MRTSASRDRRNGVTVGDDRRRSTAVPRRRPGRDRSRRRLRTRRRGRVRRGGGRNQLDRGAATRPDGHQHGRARRDRGDPPDHERQPGDQGDPRVDLRARRPPAGRPHERRDRLRQQGRAVAPGDPPPLGSRRRPRLARYIAVRPAMSDRTRVSDHGHVGQGDGAGDGGALADGGRRRRPCRRTHRDGRPC